MIFPTLDQVVKAHGAAVPGASLRLPALLEAAIGGTEQALEYLDEANRTPFVAARRLAGAISSSHPFTDGNKRASVLIFLMVLGLNGWICRADAKTLAVEAIKAARGDRTSFESIGGDCEPGQGADALALLDAFDRHDWDIEA